MNSRSHLNVDELLQRICGEFLEMPGLRLTCQQAQRLWALDETTCRNLLDSLTDVKFLSRGRDGGYSRTTEGAPPRLRLRDAVSSKLKAAV